MKLLVIDPHVTHKSPSMRAWVEALPVVRGLFDEIEIWASECDVAVGDGVVWRRVEQRLPTWTLHALDYQRRVRQMLRALPPASERLVQVTGCMVPEADIRYIHYWNSALLEERAARHRNFPLPLRAQFIAQLAARQEAAAVQHARRTDHWWVVSRALAQRIAASGATGQFDILPNQYDPGRFNHAVRNEWREPLRSHYGFQSGELVLAFSAFGHFERKGLRQAVEAVECLRCLGHPLRLLILGGSPATVRRFRKTLSPTQQDGCVFAGLVDHIERHLAAADGLLLPSHFEAFSLAEIEAAALGMRLYLTAHYGSEMILREPSNGRLLPWDPTGMAAVIAQDIVAGRLGQTHHEMGEALTKNSYQTRLRTLYQQAVTAKI